MHGFIKVFWRALLAIMAGVGVLFCVMSVIGNRLTADSIGSPVALEAAPLGSAPRWTL